MECTLLTFSLCIHSVCGQSGTRICAVSWRRLLLLSRRKMQLCEYMPTVSLLCACVHVCPQLCPRSALNFVMSKGYLYNAMFHSFSLDSRLPFNRLSIWACRVPSRSVLSQLCVIDRCVYMYKYMCGCTWVYMCISIFVCIYDVHSPVKG